MRFYKLLLQSYSAGHCTLLHTKNRRTGVREAAARGMSAAGRKERHEMRWRSKSGWRPVAARCDLNLPETEFSLGRWKVMEVGMNSSYHHSYLLLKPESKAKYMGKEGQKKCWDLGPYQTCVNHPHGSGYTENAPWISRITCNAVKNVTKELRAMSDVNWIKEIFESWWLLLKHFTSLLPLKQQVLHHSVSTFYPWSDKLEKFSVLCWTFFGLYISQEKSGKRKAFLKCFQYVQCLYIAVDKM